MKKVNVSRLCNVLSVILLACFVIKTIIDHIQYSTTLNSAPFYLWVLANALYFIVPSVILFIVGAVIKRKNKN